MSTGAAVHFWVMPDLRSLFDVSQYVQRELYLFEREYHDTASISIELITFNINESKDYKQISELFKPGKQLIAIVMQEVQMNLNTLMLAEPPIFPEIAKYFESVEVLPKMQYESFGSILFIVLYSENIKVTFQEGISCGYMNKLGNKGMISCRIELYDTRILLIGGHLSADRTDEGCKHRNNDIIQIFKQLEKWPKYCYEKDIIKFDHYFEKDTYKDTSFQQETYCNDLFEDIDYVYLMGDLNYRINNVTNLNAFIEQIKACEIAQDFEPLWSQDELKLQLDYLHSLESKLEYDQQINLQQNSRISIYTEKNDDTEFSTSTNMTPTAYDDQNSFKEEVVDVVQVYALGALELFYEDDIRFSPSYKISSDGSFNISSGRVPSYCDRILYRQASTAQILDSKYYTDRSIIIGDHFPVILEEELLVNIKNESKFDNFKKEALEKANKIQNYLVPEFAINPENVIMLTKYNIISTVEITIRNCHKEQNTKILIQTQELPKFLTISKESFELSSNSETTISLSCMYNNYLANNDILILNAVNNNVPLEVTLPFHSLHNNEVQNVEYLNISIEVEKINNIVVSSTKQIIPIYYQHIGKYLFDLINHCQEYLNEDTKPEEIQKLGSACCLLKQWRDNKIYTKDILLKEEKINIIIKLLQLNENDKTNAEAANIFSSCMTLYHIIKHTHFSPSLEEQLGKHIAGLIVKELKPELVDYESLVQVSDCYQHQLPIPLDVSPRIVLEELINSIDLIAFEQADRMFEEYSAIIYFLQSCVNYLANILPDDEFLTLRGTVFAYWCSKVPNALKSLFEIE